MKRDDRVIENVAATDLAFGNRQQADLAGGRVGSKPAVSNWVFTLALRRIQLIQRRISLVRLPGEGWDPFLAWAPAFAGVQNF